MYRKTNKKELAQKVDKKWVELKGTLAKIITDLEKKAEVDPVGTMVSTVPQELRKYLSKSIISKPSYGLHAEKYVPYRGWAKNIGLNVGTVPIDAAAQEGENLYATKLWEVLGKYYSDVTYEELKSDPLNIEKQRGYFQYANFRTGFGRAAGPVDYSSFEERTLRYHKFQFDAPELDWTKFEKALFIVKRLIKPVRVNILSEPTDYKAAYADKISNVGLPLAVKSNSLVNYKGQKLTAQKVTSELSQMEVEKGLGSTSLMFIPALRASRSQCKGIEFENDDQGISITKFDTAHRVIFMGPRVRNNKEFMIIKPILERFKTNEFLMAGYLSKQGLKKWLSKFHKLTKKYGTIPVNIDFSKFDTTIHPYLIVAAGTLLESFCEDRAGYDVLWQAVSSLLTQGMYYTDTTDNTIRLFFKFGTIPSGVTLTNLMGCLVNLLAISYSLLVIDEQFYYQILTEDNFVAPLTALGDDMLTSVTNLDHLEQMSEILKDTFGMNVNPDKGTIGVMFLQNLYDPENDTMTYRLAGTWRSLLWPETSNPLGQWQTVIALWAILSNSSETPGIVETIEYMKTVERSRLGTEWNGEKLTPNKFLELLKAELNETSSKLGKDVDLRNSLKMNNPVYESIWDETGEVKTTWIKTMMDWVSDPKVTELSWDAESKS